MAVSQSLTLSQISQSVENNTSQVRILWESTQTGTSHNDNSRTAYYGVSINGEQATQYSVSYTLPQGATKVIVDTTITVPHRNDGTGTITVDTWMDTRISAGVVEKSQTLTLSTIPRATTPTVTPLKMGSPGTITLNPASSTFTHTITYRFGIMYRGTIASRTSETSIAWTPPKSLANQLTSADTGTIHIYCTTYNGNSEIGTVDVPVKITVSDDTVPTVSVALSDTTGYKDIYGWVQNKSRLKATITAAGVMDSKIVSTKMTIDGKQVDVATENILPNSGAVSVKVIVTDSRKRTATYNTNLSVAAYTAPSINNLVYTRGSYTNNVWKENISGADIKVTFTLAMTLAANKADLTVQVDGAINKIVSNQTSGTKTIYLTGIGTDTTRKLSVSALDALGTKSSKEIVIATVEVPLNINFSLPGVCFGGIAEKEKIVQSKWPIEVEGKVNATDLQINGTSVSDLIEQSGGSGIIVDNELSSTSTNPVQNKVIKAALDNMSSNIDFVEMTADEMQAIWDAN